MTNFPAYRGKMEYFCLNCGLRQPADELLYTCPQCGGVLLLEDANFDKLKQKSGAEWREVFDTRKMTRLAALKGVFRFYELVAPILEQKDIVYLGEADTPIVDAASRFAAEIGVPFAFKNDGQNPSASFKDRGMACAFSYLKWLCAKNNWPEVLTVCASTGDTSAAAALYAAYVGPPLKSIVLLPHGKVTPQQLAQPLGAGATVLEIPGVFDDCMKVVELLARDYRVALLNSKNSWRILGQESYAYEVAQWHGWNLDNVCLFVPIGNAGNITAIMSGMLKMLDLGIITRLPRVFGAQSEHADPVFRYYAAPPGQRVWKPVSIRPSVAQAAMIGNPVSFPRVRHLVNIYMEKGGENAFQVIRVSEQEIIEATLAANRHGHIACTQGGECLAALKIAKAGGLITENERAILDSTAHILKFMDFQQKYFSDSFDPAYEIKPDPALANFPEELLSGVDKAAMSEMEFAALGAEAVANRLNLVKK